MIIAHDDNGQRLDRFLKTKFPSVTFGQAQKLIRTGQIRINGKRAKPDTRLNEGDDLRLPPQLQNDTGDHHKQFSQKNHDAIKDMILFEDADILALNKPSGLAVQGGSKTVHHIDGMLNSYEKKGVKPRLVHRLDKDTSGVLILAKTANAARELTHAFQGQDVKKTYWTITSPAPIDENGTIDAPLSKAPARGDGGDMMVHDPENGKKAITDFEILDKAGKEAALVAFYPQTGRTHQIRVHAALMGAPLLGDRKYNMNPFPEEFKGVSKRLYLHAREITFPHPNGEENLTIKAPMPKDFVKTCEIFGFAKS